VRDEDDPIPVLSAILYRTIVCSVLSVFHILIQLWAWSILFYVFGGRIADNSTLLRLSVAMLLGGASYLIPAVIVRAILRKRSVETRLAGVTWVFRTYLAVWVTLWVWIVIAFSRGPPL
jgi:hypothetical protein